MNAYVMKGNKNLRNLFAGSCLGIIAGTAAVFGFWALSRFKAIQNLGMDNLIHSALLAVSLIAIFAFIYIGIRRTGLYKSLVLLDIFLLSVVAFEPAPSDIIFCILVVPGILTNKLKLERARDQLFIILMFALYFTVSILGIAKASNTMYSVKYYGITFYLFLFSLFVFLYATRINFVSLVKAYTYSCVFTAVLGFAGYMGFMSQLLVKDSYRVNALFKDPNVYGPFIIPSIIILLDSLFNNTNLITKNKIIKVMLILSCTFSVIISFSRAAWVNLFVSSAVYIFLNIDIKKILKIIAALLVLVIIVLSVWWLMPGNEFKEFIVERARIQDYDKNRFSSQKAGLYLAAEKPSGYGPGQYENEASIKTGMRLSAHNLYIRLLMEDGVVGFILFFTGFFWIIIRLFLLYKAGDCQNCIRCSVLISILAGLMVNSLVVDTLHWRHLWFFIGLSLLKITETGGVTVSEFSEV